MQRLVFTPSRNAKIALLRHYFATQPDPDRGIGLAAITGELAFTAAKPGLIRELAAARTDPVLFAPNAEAIAAAPKRADTLAAEGAEAAKAATDAKKAAVEAQRSTAALAAALSAVLLATGAIDEAKNTDALHSHEA